MVGKSGREEPVNERTCIVSRTTSDPAALIRFVLGPDGAVVPDLKRKLPGRGAHVAMRRAAVDEAVRRKLFARAFRAQVTGPADLGAEVDALLAKAALGSLGIARKAGQLVTGATKVDAAVRSGKAQAVVQACDAAADGLRKIDAARRVAAAGGLAVPALRLVTADELGLALGGGNVIHAAILAGDAGSAAVTRLMALAKYRGENLGDGSGDADAGGRGTGHEIGNETGSADDRGPGQDEGRGIDLAQEAEA